MTAVAAFALGMGAVAAALAGSMVLILRPLAAALEELCGAKERGDFWTALSAVALGAGSLLLGLLGFWAGQTKVLHAPPPLPAAADVPLWSAIEMLRWAAVGLVLGSLAIGTVVVRFTARMSRGAACPSSVRPEG